MKKCCLLLMLPFLLLMTLTTNAADVPQEFPSETKAVNSAKVRQAGPKEGCVGSLEWIIAMNDAYWADANERFGHYHSLSFYTSMGCDDIWCTSSDHYHWCPEFCLEEEHGHSDKEYRLSDRYYSNRPPCPCHEDETKKWNGF